MEEFTRIKSNISLRDGTRWLSCEVFLPAGSRLSDVMNDGRMFIPVIREGKHVMIHKDQIAFLVEDEPIT